jgi:ribosomal protein L11 methyltransferase
LTWISNIVDPRNNQDIKLVMDYGAGSGVLGMAACKLNPDITAVGIDIDVDAVQIANQNAAINSVEMKTFLSDLVQTKDGESRSILLKAYSSKQGDVADILPDDSNGPIYDACVANILAGPLVALAPTLAGLIKPGGRLGLSGIMESQSNMILEAYQPFFDDVRVEETLGGWILVTGKRKSE